MKSDEGMQLEPTRPLFWSRSSTILVTVIRLLIIILQSVLPFQLVFPNNWLFSPNLISVLVRPHQTLWHVREAAAIQHLLSGKFADAYRANQTIRLQPLLLAPLCNLIPLKNAEMSLGIILLVVDFLIAHFLDVLGRQILFGSNPNIDEEERLQKQMPLVVRPPSAQIFPIKRKIPQFATNKESQPLLPMSALPLLAAQLYYWSPVTAMAGGTFHCFQNLPFFFILGSLCLASRFRGPESLASFCLAVAAYIEPHNCVFLVPLALWISPSHAQRLAAVFFFLLWSAALQVISYSIVGPSQYMDVLQATYGFGWEALSPNLGMLWYFHMQLFGRFQDYFGMMLSGLPFLLVVPLLFRLHKYPMVLVSQHEGSFLVS